jgi:hypothetical protein
LQVAVSRRAALSSNSLLIAAPPQNVARPGSSSQNRLAHGTGNRFGQGLAGAREFLNFLAHQFSELMIGFFLGDAVADAASRKKIGAVADVAGIFLVPLDKFQITIGNVHLLVSRIAWRICFS